MVNLILDTCTWIYLANGYNTQTSKYEGNQHFNLLSQLLELAQNHKITIYTNKIVIKEWNRNKDNIENRIKVHKKEIDDAKSFIENNITKFLDENHKGLLKQILTNFEYHKNLQIEEKKKHIEKLEDFIFNKCPSIDISKKIEEEVLNLAIDSKPPFHNKKNNINDALILLSASNYFKNSEIPDLEHIDNNIFVSNNTDDYCECKNSKNLHPELKKYFTNSSMRFETNLGKALELSKEIIQEIENYYEYLNRDLTYCHFNCKGVEYGLGEVWFNEVKIIETQKSKSLYFDKNQLHFDFGEQFIIKEQDILRLKELFSVKIDIGYCNFCNSEHIRCDCGTEFCEHDAVDFLYECSCGKIYNFENNEITLLEQDDIDNDEEFSDEND